MLALQSLGAPRRLTQNSGFILWGGACVSFFLFSLFSFCFCLQSLGAPRRLTQNSGFILWGGTNNGGKGDAANSNTSIRITFDELQRLAGTEKNANSNLAIRIAFDERFSESQVYLLYSKVLLALLVQRTCFTGTKAHALRVQQYTY